MRGLFIARPYKVPEQASTVLAQICCWNNELPQGAPTSPTVSNMICARLDTQLIQLARAYQCTYTRYADDITFSTTRKRFPATIAVQKHKSNPYAVQPGTRLEQVITANGFEINTSKVRLLDRYGRQEVTGLTVNEFPNVSRSFLNQIRAMLHAWKKFGLKNAATHHVRYFRSRCDGPYKAKHVGTVAHEAFFKNVVWGKINYLRMVKGDHDQVTQKFCALLAEEDPQFRKVFQRFKTPHYYDMLFVTQTDTCQGTAFALKGVGIVTCKHVLDGDHFHIHKGETPDDAQQPSLIWEDKQLDLAVFKAEEKLPFGFEIGDSDTLKQEDEISVLGFPSYADGEKFKLCKGHITGDKILFGIPLKTVSAQILHGNSGGPVLDANGMVIGIATRGARDPDEAIDVLHSFIPLNTLQDKFR